MKQFIFSILKSGLVRFIGLGFGFVFFGFAASQYGAEVMGRFAIAVTILSLVSTLCCLGFVSSLVRFVSGDLEAQNDHMPTLRLNWVLKLTGGLALIASVILFAVRDVVAHYIFNDALLSPFLLLSAFALLPYGANLLLTSYHQAHHRVVWSSMLRFLCVPFFASIFLFAFWYLGNSQTVPILAHVLGIACSFVLGLLLYVLFEKKQSSKHVLDHEEQRDMLRVSVPLLFAGISGMLLGWADTLMLGAMSDAQTTGLYAVAFRFGVFVALPYQIIGWVVISKLAASYKANDVHQQQKLLSDSVHMAVLASFPLVLAFVVFGEPFLGLFGEEFTQAYWILVVIVLGEFIGLCFGYTGTIMAMGHQQKQYQYVLMASVLFNVGLNFILIPLYGAMGAAIATVATHVVKQGGMCWYIYRGYGLTPIAGWAWLNMKRL